MALSDSAVSELDAFRAGDGVDLVRESVRLVRQAKWATPRERDNVPGRNASPHSHQRSLRVRGPAVGPRPWLSLVIL